MRNKMSQRIIWFIFAVYFLFLYKLHRQVFLYFDDYGYASLSYGFSVGTSGLQYGIGDIIEYLTWHYLNWGGRVLCFFFEISSIKMGLEFIQIIQALILWGIGFLSYLLIRENKNADLYKALSIVLLFGTLGLIVLNKGVFWFSASVAYVWPLLPLFALVYMRGILRKKYSTIKVVCAMVIAFTAAFSYEQIAVLIVVYVVMDCVFARLYGQKQKYEWGILAATICGAALEIFAPGNFVRSSNPIYNNFREMSIWDKLSANVPHLLEMNFGVNNRAFTIVLIVTGLLAILYCERKGLRLCLGLAAYLSMSVMVLCLWKIDMPIYAGAVCRAIWVMLFVVYMISMLWKMQRSDLCALFIGGLCSEGMILFTPTLPGRCMIPFDFVLIIVIGSAAGIEFSRCNVAPKVLLICLTCVLSVANMTGIFRGYCDNYDINMINDSKLREKSMRIAAGEDISTIILYRLPNDAYAADMPYQQQYIEGWIKNYYEIPQEVLFVWENMNNIGTVREVVISDTP